MVCWLRLHQSNSWAEGRTQVGKQRFPHAFWRGWGEIWPQYTEAQFRQGGLEGSQEQLEGQGRGGRRAEGPESQQAGRLRGAKGHIPEGSPEAAACAQQGCRAQRRGRRNLGGPETRRGHRSWAPIFKGQNRVRTEPRRSSAPRWSPRSVRTAPEGKRVDGGGCGRQAAPCFPRRGPGGWRFHQRWMPRRPLFASRRETGNAALSLPYQSYSSP